MTFKNHEWNFHFHLSVTIVVEQISSEICINVSNFPPHSFHSSHWSILTIKRPLKERTPLNLYVYDNYANIFVIFMATTTRRRLFALVSFFTRSGQSETIECRSTRGAIISRREKSKKLREATYQRHYLFLSSPCIENN